MEVEEFDEATLPLLFKAATWERTLHTTKTQHRGGGGVSLHAVDRGFKVSSGVCNFGAITEECWRNKHQNTLTSAPFSHGLRSITSFIHWFTDKQPGSMETQTEEILRI